MKKIKLLKTLLIPSLGALTLGTIATVATSCNNSTYSITGGSLTLKGVHGTAGSDKNEWKLSKEGQEVTEGITWSIVEPVSGVSINNGKVSWTNTISSGTYKFKVAANYNNQTYTSTDITLTISSKSEVTGGSLTLKGVHGTAGSDEKTWVLKKDGEVITEGVTWSIVDSIAGVSINNGKVSWTDTIPVGNYSFLVKATYGGETFNSKAVTLTISSESEVTGGSTQLYGAYGKEGSDEQTWVFKKGGEVITEGVTWSIVEPVSGVSINNGKVSWTNAMEIGTYRFNVAAAYNDQTYYSVDITLVIGAAEYKVEGGSLALKGIHGTAGSDEKTWVLKKDGEVVTKGVTWSIVDPIAGVSINNGKVSWTDTIPVGNHLFLVKATYGDETFNSEVVTLTIAKCEVEGGSTQLFGAYGNEGSDEKTEVLKKGGEVITEGITWSIVEPVSGVSINNGKVSWTNTISSGTYKFKVAANYDNQTYTSTDITLNISSASEVTGGSLTLKGVHGTAGSDEKTWALKKAGEVITEGVTWSIVDPIAGVSINNGKVSWVGAIQSGTYKFKVVATYEGQAFASSTVTLTIDGVYQFVGESKTIDFVATNTGRDEGNEWHVMKDGDVVTEGVTWKLVATEGSSVPEWIKLNENNEISWTNAVEGTYSFNIQAEYDGKTFTSSSPFVLNVGAKVFECVEVLANENSTITLINENNSPDLSYSFNGIGWNSYTSLFPLSIPEGQTLYLRGWNPDGWSKVLMGKRISSLHIEGDASISGNVMGLLDNGTRAVRDIPCDNCFYSLFKESTGITSVSDNFLPATELQEYCYHQMFQGCTSLTTAPDLPSWTLKKYCYKQMFQGCTSLTKAPDLPAVNLEENCYNSMFMNCTSLNSIKIGYFGLPSDAPDGAFDNWVDGVADKGTFYYRGPEYVHPTLFYLPILWVTKHYN